MSGNEKSISLLLKLSENPFYTLTPEEESRLEAHLLAEGVDIEDEVKKKKPSKGYQKNVTATEKNRVSKHETFPPEFQV